MFVRFRATSRTLQASLVETRRDGGGVRHDHIASLGTIRIPQVAAARIVFWTQLHQRLATLANRIGGNTYGAILAAVHARIPMPTPDDQQAVQLENARAEVALLETLADMRLADVEANKALAASVNKTIADHEAGAADAADKARAAAERLAKAERGENVDGIGRPLTYKEILAVTGWTKADLRQQDRLIQIGERGADGLLMDEIMKRRRQSEKAAARAVLRRRHPFPPN